MRRADHSSRGVLPTVVCPCVWQCNLGNEEAQTRMGCKMPDRRIRRTVWNPVINSITAACKCSIHGAYPSLQHLNRWTFHNTITEQYYVDFYRLTHLKGQPTSIRHTWSPWGISSYFRGCHRIGILSLLKKKQTVVKYAHIVTVWCVRSVIISVF